MIKNYPYNGELLLRLQDETDDGLGFEYTQKICEAISACRELHTDRNKPAFLLIRKPRLPLKNILFILRGDRRDNQAIKWMMVLTRRFKAAVNILIVYPDVPGFYTRSSRIQLDVSLLLQIESGIGGMLRRLILDFHKHEIEWSIQQHIGTPDNQIHQEVATYPCDLVIVSGEQRSWLWRVYFGEILKPLLRWIDRPVLVI